MNFDNNLTPSFYPSRFNAVSFADDEKLVANRPVKKSPSDTPVLFLPALNSILSPSSKSLAGRSSFNQQNPSALVSRPKTASSRRRILPALAEPLKSNPGFLLDQGSDIPLDLEDKFLPSPRSLRVERIHSGRQSRISSESRVLTPLEKLILPDDASKEPGSWIEFHSPIAAHKPDSLQYSSKLKFLTRKIHKFVEDWDLLHSMNENPSLNNESIQEKAEFLKTLVKQLIKAMPSIESHLMDMRLKIEEIL